MGYTHYWKRKKAIDLKKMESMVSDFKMAYREIRSSVDLAGPGGVGKPIIDEISVAFNGRRICGHKKNSSCEGDCSHEPFLSSRISRRTSWHDPDSKEYFDFCKTARKPYDLAVMIFLIIAKQYLKSTFVVGSDGSDDDWLKAKQLCQRIFGYGMDFKLERNRSLLSEFKDLETLS